MNRVQLTLGAIHTLDRTGPILDGQLAIEGAEFTTYPLGPVELFRRVAQDAEFDVAEMSLSTFIAMVSRGDTQYVGLPIFPSRAFRHGSIVVRRDSGISSPSDLRGKRVGMSEYVMTAALWIRGMFADDFGVTPAEIEWFEGGLNEFEPPRVDWEPPDWLALTRIPGDQTLNGLLVSGELDAVIDARLPASFVERAQEVGRLFPDYRRVEEDYFRRTGFFPIMHLVVLRRDLHERHPWLAKNIFSSFDAARRTGIARLWDTGSLACSLPWLYAELERTAEIFGVARGGDGFWAYGVDGNGPTLEYMTEQSLRQGISNRKVGPDELFVPI